MKPKEAAEQAAQRVKEVFTKYRAPCLVILLGLVLLAVPTGEPEAEVPAESPAITQFDLADLEHRLSEALSRIDGAGEVTVVLTVRNGPRQILAQNTDRGEGEESTETVVLSRGNSQQETVTVQELYPAYQGALLVCPGGDNPDVRLKLTEAASVLTGLGADKISISQGK